MDNAQAEEVRERGQEELVERLRPAPPERDSSGGYEIKPPRKTSKPPPS
jgi:hypothetical protein